MLAGFSLYDFCQAMLRSFLVLAYFIGFCCRLYDSRGGCLDSVQFSYDGFEHRYYYQRILHDIGLSKSFRNRISIPTYTIHDLKSSDRISSQYMLIFYQKSKLHNLKNIPYVRTMCLLVSSMYIYYEYIFVFTELIA